MISKNYWLDDAFCKPPFLWNAPMLHGLNGMRRCLCSQDTVGIQLLKMWIIFLLHPISKDMQTDFFSANRPTDSAMAGIFSLPRMCVDEPSVDVSRRTVSASSDAGGVGAKSKESTSSSISTHPFDAPLSCLPFVFGIFKSVPFKQHESFLKNHVNLSEVPPTKLALQS